jgi:hypothetical protein
LTLYTISNYFHFMAYLVAFILIAIGGAAFYFFQATPSTDPVSTVPIVEVNEPANSPAAPETISEEPQTETSSPAEQETTDYQDGTYTTNVTYITPKRATYGMNVSLTLNQDIITGATIVYTDGAEKDPNAAKFEAAYKTQIIGKDIDTISLSRVGGASLTTNAFNDAVANIKADAQS